eukprot:2414188-Rhodomonas_salina.1
MIQPAVRSDDCAPLPPPLYTPDPIAAELTPFAPLVACSASPFWCGAVAVRCVCLTPLPLCAASLSVPYACLAAASVALLV